MKLRRRAYTLIESMVVLALTSTTLLLVTVTMHKLHRAEHRLREDLRSQRALEQLAFQLRLDAHDAASAVIGEAAAAPSQSVRLVSPDDQSIEYSSSATGVERVVRRGETVSHRDRFRLAAAADSSWTIETRSEHPVIVFHWLPSSSHPLPASTHPSAWRIRTAVGINRHLVHHE